MKAIPSSLIPIAEVAKRTGRSRELLRRWAVAGRVPAIKVGRDWYIREDFIAVIKAMPRRRRSAPGIPRS